IFGAPQPDGRGIQFIYEDNGRMIEAAGIAGNVKDESLLELLKTTEGFRKLVHSIGVSVTEENSAPVRFVFQMYGEHQNDPATSITCDMTADGIEQVIPLDSVDWMSSDRIPGQIRFEFDTPQLVASADVRFYLNDGYEAPPQLSETAIEFDSEDYRQMIGRSRRFDGNLTALHRAVEKARRGEPMTISFIGGSITQGAGAIPINEKSYARLYTEDFAARYATKPDQIKLVKAGVGGTPSELGMLRFERDVLRDGTEQPDIIVIEFAVNDDGDETKGVCYESLVRKALMLPWHPAVVLLFAVFAFDWNLQDRLRPVGERYELPMVSVLDAVTPQFGLMPGKGRVLSKNQFFYDVFHPSNTGHRIMADCLLEMTRAAEAYTPAAADGANVDVTGIQPAIGADFDRVRMFDRKELGEDLSNAADFGVESLTPGAFTGKDEDIQRVEMDYNVSQTPEFPYNWSYDGSESDPAPFRLRIRCAKLLLIFKDSGDVHHGTALVTVDGKQVLEADPLKVGWTHCNAAIVFNEEQEADHEVVIGMAPGQADKKFTILGFGVVRNA
ncbi:MAG: SGNH/GDSL hydrolase family protein, partial [Butyrivibrio sp.]|nr:SGNH/GDSL hydrolase family protein [Butyrivibrio sp.]